MLCAAFAGLGVLAAIAMGLSALPPAVAAALALLAAWHGLRLARGEWRRSPASLLLEEPLEAKLLRAGAAGESLAGAALFLRGPLTILAWRDVAGARRSLLWFADTLPAASRRRLRLHFSAAGAGSA
jgi:hypothetical protein